MKKKKKEEKKRKKYVCPLLELSMASVVGKNVRVPAESFGQRRG